MQIEIGNIKIGENNPVFIIAELSANHLQDLDLALKTIRAAKEVGVDAIKLQTYTPDTITLDCNNKYFQIHQGTIWDGITLYNLYKEAYTPWEWHEQLMSEAKELELICFSSPFDYSSVDFLENLNTPAYKIASFEITDIPLIQYVASKRKPIIISTGVSYLADIELAVNTCRKMGNNQIILLKCASTYPTPLDEVNLKTIPVLGKIFGTLIGISDHTNGISVPIAAVSLGAKVIEKHIILDRSLGGPDSTFSLEPDEFKQLVTSVREVEKALGDVDFALTDKMIKSREHSRSLFVTKDIFLGEVFTKENIRSIRPGYGLHPKFLDTILGKKSRYNIKKGTPLQWDLIE